MSWYMLLLKNTPERAVLFFLSENIRWANQLMNLEGLMVTFLNSDIPRCVEVEAPPPFLSRYDFRERCADAVLSLLFFTEWLFIFLHTTMWKFVFCLANIWRVGVGLTSVHIYQIFSLKMPFLEKNVSGWLVSDFKTLFAFLRKVSKISCLLLTYSLRNQGDYTIYFFWDWLNGA